MPKGPDRFQKQIVIENLHKHVEYLSVKIGDRHLWKGDSLDRTAEYIESAVSGYGYAVERQSYSSYGKTVSNLIVEKRGESEGVVIVGAHYDSVPGTPGADDNASSVAGLLELARLCKESPSRKTLVFAAFVNEEPPSFGSRNMGSMVYAKHLKDNNISIDVMISLEMIGFFSEEVVQGYPLPGMDVFYPKKGNFIGIVGNFPSSRYVFLLKRGIRKHSNMIAKSLTAPEFFGGINLSDHYSFWQHGYRAVMITDTSFYRNRNYHQETDTIDTLNFERMAELVKGLYFTLREF
ncbi:Peptidase family M28 [Syntrophus gentianae]|uniref:Peptidase family M28 n=1 Tax=Syntrophus gentianae TaxID=43775 RepID=A0A1H7WE11_9BACT|nr:M28 family peptidase [Syntrophus gentianae]SEM19711.1 Peptidase family M28 [Syntrophus gentianae]